MHDPGLQAVPGAVPHEAVEDPGGDDAAAADQHDARPVPQGRVDVLVILVRVYHVVEVPVLQSEALQVRQELEPRIADGEMHVAGPDGDPLTDDLPGFGVSTVT